MRRELKVVRINHIRSWPPGHKAYPDEKGTERWMNGLLRKPKDVTRHIPMRRELKGILLCSLHDAIVESQGISR